MKILYLCIVFGSAQNTIYNRTFDAMRNTDWSTNVNTKNYTI